jgi:hypothetical protein
VRYLVVGLVLLLACSKEQLPVQDPLDYLRVGVDPRQEAEAIIEDLRRHGFEIGRRIDESGYVAFDAAHGADATVRVITSRGMALSVQAPDVRWPERLWVELSEAARPDFDGDGQRDILVAVRERERTCLAWAQVDRDGFASEVFRPKTKWGDSPCVIEIDPAWPRLLLEVSVPDASVPDARVRLPIKAKARSWVLDDSAAASARWDREIAQRRQALDACEMQGDTRSAARLRAELAWLEQLREASEPVLEPADDDEEAR